jgi:ABC-type phosphate transport system substrate-binding protein
MSFLHRVRGPTRIALLAGAVAAVSLGSVGAGTAAANRPCQGASIVGGSNVPAAQLAAQATWATGFNTNPLGCTTGSPPTVSTIAPAPSGGSGGPAPRQPWGADGGCASTGFTFIATDRAPNVVERANMQRSVASCGGTGTTVHVVPVIQYAIAIVVHLPASCTLTRLTLGQLEMAFRGSGAIPTWTSLGGTGSGCGASIRHVVPSYASGLSYQLKHFFSTVNAATFCAITTTWRALQNPDTGWCLDNGATVTSTDVVNTVNTTSSSIGFTTLADRTTPLGTGVTVLNIQGLGSLSASPTSGGDANCSTANGAYQNAAGTLPATSGDWTDVYLVTPGPLRYPLCALSWDLALQDYQPLWGTPLGQQVGQTVHDFLTYVIGTSATTGGQIDVAGREFAALPADVRTQASTGVGSIVTMP